MVSDGIVLSNTGGNDNFANKFPVQLKDIVAFEFLFELRYIIFSCSTHEHDYVYI